MITLSDTSLTSESVLSILCKFKFIYEQLHCVLHSGTNQIKHDVHVDVYRDQIQQTPGRLDLQ